MKNATALSLVTAAILGLTGCGGEGGGSSSAGASELSSIKTLSNASDKHSKAEWDKIENEIQNLDKTEKFNTVLLDSIEKNIVMLNSVGVDKEDAYAINSDAMYDDLVKIEIEDLDNQVVTECKDDDTCKEEAYASLETNFEIDKEEAYGMAEDFRGEENTLVNDKLVRDFRCDEGEVRTVQHYGVEDLFSTANGVEATSQRAAAINQNMINYNNNVNAPFAPYDETSNDRLFLDNIDNLPAGITKGMFYIGLKSNGSGLQVNDTMSLGDLTQIAANRFAEQLSDLDPATNSSSTWMHQLASNANPTTDVYYNSLVNIELGSQTLLDHVQTTQQFDAYVQDDTSVDFITVATCSKPDPVKEIERIVNKFECSEKETLVKIIGGEIDAFTGGTDASNPSSGLLANYTYGNGRADYDQTIVNKALIDTLDLSQASAMTITKAEFHIGYKSLGDPLTGNDTIHIGEYGAEHVGGRYLLYPNGTNSLTPMPWVPRTVIINANEVEQLLSVDLNKTTSSNSNINMLDWIQGKSAFDIRVEDDTAVDFTQLNLCVKGECGELNDINLTQDSFWNGDAFSTLLPATLPSSDNTGRRSWAPSMEWFDFSANNQNNNSIQMQICACDDITLTVDRLKADNSAKVYLDSTLVVDHVRGTGQSAFIEDNWQNNSGRTSSGSHTVSIPAGTPQTHTLTIDVKDDGVVTGMAIEGTLNFRGYLGACKE